MKTSDGGNSWTMQREGSTVRQFRFSGPQRGYAVGGSSILRTEDGGDSWMDITPVDGRIDDLRAVFFLDESHGWVVGHGRDEQHGSKLYKVSLVLETTDSGAHWDIAEFLFDYSPYQAHEAEQELD